MRLAAAAGTGTEPYRAHCRKEGFFMPVKDKNVKQHVLRVLEEHRGGRSRVSGAKLAAGLAVSRTAIWKAINELKQEGYVIDSSRQGYSLAADSDLLSAQGIAAHLRHRELAAELHIYDTVESTNLTAKQLALSGAPHGTVVAAATQTAGRGRLGRSFFSPRDTGVYFSMILHPRCFPPDAAAENTSAGSSAAPDPVFMTTAAAVAISRAIEQVSGCSVQIKWVNDLYLHGKKVCGILTEGIADLETASIETIVVGAGINCFPPASDFPQEIRTRAGVLSDAADSARFSKNELIAASIDALTDIQAELANRGFLEEYRRRSFVLGKEIYFGSGTSSEEYHGIAAAIDERGGLIVRLADGTTRTLSTGEISVRTADPAALPLEHDENSGGTDK